MPMRRDDFEEALRLCSSVRADLTELVRLWTRRAMEDVHAASEFTRAMGGDHLQVDARLRDLERELRRGDLEAISKGDWPVYQLVNYYDVVIDRLQCRRMSAGSGPREMEALRRWRNTAGLLAQYVCCLEDA